LDLLYYLEGVENLLIIDAVETGHEPGFMLRLENEQVPAFMSLKMSPHQVGVPDMLFAAKLKGIFPRRVTLLGIQPEVLEIGLDLSPVIAAQLPALTDQVLEQLKEWGHVVSAKG
jgi:hydrogenase maturation protease